MPGANSRPRRNRHTPSQRVDPNPVGAPGTVSQMRNPERSGWQRSQVTSKICQRCVVDLSADSANRTTRQHLLALQEIIIPYKSTTWASARLSGSPGEAQSVAPSRLRMTTGPNRQCSYRFTPGSYYKSLGYSSCVRDARSFTHILPSSFTASHYTSGKQERALPTAALTFP